MLNIPLRKLQFAVAQLLLLDSTILLQAQDPDLIRWVSPTIGSGEGPIGYGGTMPFVTPPFGMTDWTPQTRQNRLSGVSYNYADKTISGFMGTHQPAIWMGDYGYVTLMPEVGDLKLTPDSRALPFSHTTEHASPDGYTVALDAGSGCEIANAEYGDAPAGLDGDDDCGQMSAWYLFTALGFYPVNPASGDYMIGSPLFSTMRLNLPSGKSFTVDAHNDSATNVYIQSAMLNGESLDKPVLTWEQIMSGGTLTLELGPKPSCWASDWTPTPLPGKPTGNPTPQ